MKQGQEHEYIQQDGAFPNNHLQIHGPSTLPRDGGQNCSVPPAPKSQVALGVTDPHALKVARAIVGSALLPSPMRRKAEHRVNEQPRGSLKHPGSPTKAASHCQQPVLLKAVMPAQSTSFLVLPCPAAPHPHVGIQPSIHPSLGSMLPGPGKGQSLPCRGSWHHPPGSSAATGTLPAVPSPRKQAQREGPLHTAHTTAPSAQGLQKICPALGNARQRNKFVF